MLQKKTHTFVTELDKDSYFGELGVLIDQPRMLSAKCRDFTEALTLEGVDFFRTCEHYMAAGASVKRI